MVTYVSGIPPINVDERNLSDLLDQDGIRTALHVNTDPVTGVAMVAVYHDDGRGNGLGIFSVPLAELRAIAKRLGTTTHRGFTIEPVPVTARVAVSRPVPFSFYRTFSSHEEATAAIDKLLDHDAPDAAA